MANLKDIDKNYISEHDEFLFEFDSKHPLSASQQKEVDKHKKIAQLRDGLTDETEPKESE